MTRTLSLLALCLVLAGNPLQAADEQSRRVIEEGRDYVRVIPAQPTSAAPGKVEVIEFFWYGCPHCYSAEKHIVEWLESEPRNVVFRRVPATLSRSWVLMAQAYYTAEALGVLDVMHPALFAAFHEETRMLGSEDRLASFFAEKADIDEADFRETFNSMQVSSKVQRADILSRRYRISGVPTMTVNGKFLTNPEKARGYEEMVDTVDQLVLGELDAQPE